MSFRIFVHVVMIAIAYGGSASVAFAQSITMVFDDAEIEYVEQGTGEPVVLVHGHISDQRVWGPTMEQLSKSYRVFAYTQRYYGDQQWPDKGENFKRSVHVSDLIRFVETLDAGPVYLVTRSYGGYVGMHAAAQRPALFKKMVHFEPAIADHIQGLPGYTHAWGEIAGQFPRVMNALKNDNTEHAAMEFLKIVYRLPQDIDTPPLNPELVQMVKDNGRTMAPFLSMQSLPGLTCDDLAKIDIPTLVVQGEKTHVWFSMAAEYLATCLADARLETLAGVNHDGITRQHETFLQLVKEMFNSGQ